jgi:flagellar export protein FliJ
MPAKSPYSLDALLKKRRWDLDSASAETIEARLLVEKCAEECRHLGESIAALEDEIRSVIANGKPIDTTRHSLLGVYLADRRVTFKAKQAELRNCEEEFEKRRHRLFKVKQGVMVIEKHKEGVQKEQAQHELRNEQNQSDDLWLQRRKDL